MNENEPVVNKPSSKQNWIGVTIIVVLIALGAYYFGRQGNSTTVPSPSSTTLTPQPTQDRVGSVIDYTQAPNYIGKNALVKGTIVRVNTSRKGTVFFDYCSDYKSCPFTAVVFSSNSSNFNNLSSYEGKTLTIKGFIKTYQGRAEIILDNQNQIVKVE